MEGLLEDLRGAPEYAIVLLHACAHNPTGSDPTKEEWGQILELVKVRCLYTHISVLAGVAGIAEYSIYMYRRSGNVRR